MVVHQGVAREGEVVGKRSNILGIHCNDETTTLVSADAHSWPRHTQQTVTLFVNHVSSPTKYLS